MPLPGSAAAAVFRPASFHRVRRASTVSDAACSHIRYRRRDRSHLSDFDEEFEALYTNPGSKIPTVELLLQATRARDNGRILRWLRYAQVSDPNSIRNIPATTFTEILRLFSPDRELTPVTDSVAHTWWFPDSLGHLRSKGAQNAYAGLLRNLVDMRVDGGAPLSPLDLKLLMRGAGAANDVNLATDTIKEMSVAGHYVDVECFNSVMRAILYNRRGGSAMIGFTVNRLWQHSRKKGVTEWAPPMGGYMTRIQNVYKNMLLAGGVANQETIALLMVSYAREGRMSEVARVLHAVWGVDVDAVSSLAEPPPPKPMEPGSPLMPTEDLLLAVVEAYGTNSQTMTAMALVDYLSTWYKIPISRRLWDALLIQVYVESNPVQGRPTNKSLHDNPRLSIEAPVKVFGTMCAEPYNVKPSMISYYFVIKRATQAFRWIRAIELLRGAAKLYEQLAVEAMEASRDVVVGKMRIAEGGVMVAPMFELAQRRETKLLEFRRSRVMMESLCHMFIKGGIVPGAFHVLDESDKDACTDPLGYAEDHPAGSYIVQPLWVVTGLPDFIKEFAHFLPPEVSYRTQTGFVRLQVRENSTVEPVPALPGEMPTATPLNADMTRRVVHRRAFKEELGEYEMQLSGGYVYNPHRLLHRFTHWEDPPWPRQKTPVSHRP